MAALEAVRTAAAALAAVREGVATVAATTTLPSVRARDMSAGVMPLLRTLARLALYSLVLNVAIEPATVMLKVTTWR